MMIDTLRGLPAAPNTYAARYETTEIAKLDEALAELAQQPWIEILGVDPGTLMPGDLSEELSDLETDPEASSKDYAIRTMGLLEYHQSRLRITVRALHFSDFRAWLAAMQSIFRHFSPGQVRWTVEMLPTPSGLFFSLQFPYTDVRQLEFFGSAMLHSLISTPV